jgi:4-hydroxybenzoate polyprenyltransferase
MRAYLQLVRAPNVFTAAADVLAGFLLTHERLAPALPLALLLAASCLLYMAGMVLNDYFDREQDAHERPFRPIPSGRVSARTALALGLGMMAAGVASAWTASLVAGDWRPGIVASLLAAAVLAYDGAVKQTPLGPLAMGACRSLNVLLGMSVSLGPLGAAHAAVALGVGLYIVGVTVFARSEAAESGRGPLTLGLAVLLLGIAAVASLPVWITGRELPPFDPPPNWYVFWALLAMLLGWRCLRAILDPVPQRVQTAVRGAIFSLVIIDAGAVMAVHDVYHGVLVLLLLVPMLTLGRWIYST